MPRLTRFLAAPARMARGLATAAVVCTAEDPPARIPPLPASQPPPRFLLLDHGPGKREARHSLSSTQAPGSRVIAEVLPPDAHPRGAVALFDVFTRGHAELRRLPARGCEDAAVPLCRVLELGDAGPALPGVDGRWRVVAKGPDGSVNRLTWEWWADGPELAGRFDPDTDYRFAQVERGRRDGGRVAFFVQYIQDRYEITGTAAGEGWGGSWRKLGDDGHGTWSAERASHGTSGGNDPAPRRDPPRVLQRWARKSDGSVWHGLEGTVPPGDGWAMDGELGRAWKAGGVAP